MLASVLGHCPVVPLRASPQRTQPHHSAQLLLLHLVAEKPSDTNLPSFEILSLLLKCFHGVPVDSNTALDCCLN